MYDSTRSEQVHQGVIDANGKLRSNAESILYKASTSIKEKTGERPVTGLQKAIDHVKPSSK